jgi:uncharacterized membrane protein
VKKSTQLEVRVRQWTEAGLIDAQAGARLLAFEASREVRATFRGPILLALIFGGILFAAGATLFVAAHWDELSPGIRLSLVVLMVGLLHLGGAVLADRFPALSVTLHALGTVTLGAAIFLTAQIFNLHENWATGVLLWAIGAAGGYVLLRDWTQAGLLALLAPIWLICQWTITMEGHSGGHRPLAVGLVLTALTYLSARIGEQDSTARRTLVWIGGIALLPCVGTAIAIASVERSSFRYDHRSPLFFGTLLAGWLIALAGPLVLAWLLRSRGGWINLLWAAWAYVLIVSAAHMHSFSGGTDHQSLVATLALYVLCAVGAAGLVGWGLHEKRKERLNLGIAGLAVSVLFFYFDSFMGKLGRSASLLVLGLLCLAGGYALEVTRRRLAARMELGQ